MWTDQETARVFSKIDALQRDMVDMQRKLTAIPALAPESGGDGEEAKTKLLLEMTRALQPDELDVVKAPDARVPCGYRPSVVARWHGESRSRTIWIMSHTDIVPPGPAALWEGNPYDLIERDGKLIGRGVEDNQQSLVASFFAVKGMLECGLKPRFNVGLMFMADEEVGSAYGAHYLVSDKVPRYVLQDDIVLVPDGGERDGSCIEVAEKSILWLKCSIHGKQAHGSRPDKGNNAHRAGALLLTALDEAFHSAYPETDSLFEPPCSTFEPTKKEANVENVNTIPAEDVFFFDCRILPGPRVEDVIALARAMADRIESERGVRITFDTTQCQQSAPATSVDSEVVRRLTRAIAETRGIKARPIGIGGGTVAAVFRKAGIPAAVWATLEETAHQPNESCVIKNMVADTKVFAHMFGQP